MDTSQQLSLQNIRKQLIRQEDTIIFCLVERSQYLYNEVTYIPGGIPLPNKNSQSSCSMLEYMLRETERMHGQIRRYTSPDEHAFYSDSVPRIILPPLHYPQVLARYAKEINLNEEVMQMYLSYLLPGITMQGDDGNYGSTALCDVSALQALSKRIHYGKFVAEAKFQAQEGLYSELIKNGDEEGIMKLLTNQEVEDKVVERVSLKASVFGQDISQVVANSEVRVQPKIVADLYSQWVMPLTKKVQVQYLLKRLSS